MLFTPIIGLSLKGGEAFFVNRMLQEGQARRWFKSLGSESVEGERHRAQRRRGQAQ